MYSWCGRRRFLGQVRISSHLATLPPPYPPAHRTLFEAWFGRALLHCPRKEDCIAAAAARSPLVGPAAKASPQRPPRQQTLAGGGACRPAVSSVTSRASSPGKPCPEVLLLREQPKTALQPRQAVVGAWKALERPKPFVQWEQHVPCCWLCIRFSGPHSQRITCRWYFAGFPGSSRCAYTL